MSGKQSFLSGKENQNGRGFESKLLARISSKRFQTLPSKLLRQNSISRKKTKIEKIKKKKEKDKEARWQALDEKDDTPKEKDPQEEPTECERDIDDEDDDEEDDDDDDEEEEEPAIEVGTEFEEEKVIFPVDNLPLCCDVKVEFSQRETFSSEKIMHFWFNTAFINDNRFVLMKDEIDKACKDKKHHKYPKFFRVELVLKNQSDDPPTPAASRARTDKSVAVVQQNGEAPPLFSVAPRPAPTLLTKFREKYPNLSPTEEADRTLLNKKIIWTDPPRNAHIVALELLTDITTELVKLSKQNGPILTISDIQTLKKTDWFTYFNVATCELQKVELVSLNLKQRLCFWLNVYNLMAMHGHLKASLPIGASKDLFKDWAAFFKNTKYEIDGQVYSLGEIEHAILRGGLTTSAGKYPHATPKFKIKDPRSQHVITEAQARVSYALNFGARSCPFLQIYYPETLFVQLDEAKTAYLQASVDINLSKNQVILPILLSWHQKEFGKKQTEMLTNIAEHLSIEKRQGLLTLSPTLNVKYADFDWTFSYFLLQLHSLVGSPPLSSSSITALSPLSGYTTTTGTKIGRTSSGNLSSATLQGNGKKSRHDSCDMSSYSVDSDSGSNSSTLVASAQESNQSITTTSGGASPIVTAPNQALESLSQPSNFFGASPGAQRLFAAPPPLAPPPLLPSLLPPNLNLPPSLPPPLPPPSIAPPPPLLSAPPPPPPLMTAPPPPPIFSSPPPPVLSVAGSLSSSGGPPTPSTLPFNNGNNNNSGGPLSNSPPPAGGYRLGGSEDPGWSAAFPARKQNPDRKAKSPKKSGP